MEDTLVEAVESIKIHISPELFLPAESEHFSGTANLPVMKFGPDLYTFDQPLTWEIDVTNTGEALLVGGTCEVDGATACGRCGDVADVPLFGEIEGYFLLEPQDEDQENPESEKFDVVPNDHNIDIFPLIRTALMLDVPVIPLCDDDCKGLCPTCGQNLNQGACECDKEHKVNPTSPFAALAGFVVEDKNEDTGKAEVDRVGGTKEKG